MYSEEVAKHLEQVHHSYQKQVRFLEDRNRVVATEFEQFKQDNDLDAYFEKNLDVVSKQRLLARLKDFQQQTEFLNIDKNLIERLHETNAKEVLEDIVKEYNNYRKAKIEIIETSIHREWVGTSNTPFFMGPNEYRTEFAKTLNEDVIEKSIDKSKMIALETLSKLLKKDCKEAACQTLSIRQIFQDQANEIMTYQCQIQALQDKTFTIALENKQHKEKIARLQLEGEKLLDVIKEKDKHNYELFEEIKTRDGTIFQTKFQAATQRQVITQLQYELNEKIGALDKKTDTVDLQDKKI